MHKRWIYLLDMRTEESRWIAIVEMSPIPSTVSCREFSPPVVCGFNLNFEDISFLYSSRMRAKFYGKEPSPTSGPSRILKQFPKENQSRGQKISRNMYKRPRALTR